MCGQLDAPPYDPPAGRRRVLYLELPDAPPPPEPDDREPDMPEPDDREPDMPEPVEPIVPAA